MYFNYTTRSLLCGGQRALLAVFCVAAIAQVAPNAFVCNLAKYKRGHLQEMPSLAFSLCIFN